MGGGLEGVLGSREIRRVFAALNSKQWRGAGIHWSENSDWTWRQVECGGGERIKAGKKKMRFRKRVQRLCSEDIACNF